MSCVLVLAEVASAEAAKVSGGMSILSPELITAMFSGIAMMLGAVGALMWGNHRSDKKIKQLEEKLRITNDPLNVHRVEDVVTKTECAAWRCEIQKKIEQLGPALGRIFETLKDNNKQSEARAQALHMRIDPMLAQVAANKAETKFVKELLMAKERKDGK